MLASNFHHRDLIPMTTASSQGEEAVVMVARIPALCPVPPKMTEEEFSYRQGFLIGKWTQLMNVIDEIVTCKFITDVLGADAKAICNHRHALMDYVKNPFA